MEELFHWRSEEVPSPPMEWVLLQRAAPTLQTGEYTEYVFTFEQLEILLQLLARSPSTPPSPCYETFPLTLTALVHTRRAPARAEVQHLALLPLIQNLRLDPSFQQSINTFLLRTQDLV